MKPLIGSLLALSLLASASAFAQQPPRDDDRDHAPPHKGAPQHQDQDQGHRHDGPDGHQPPRKGDRLAKGHWGDRVPDYNKHGLRRPPKGHEWRRVDGNYVLVAVATGVIASVIANSH